MYSKDLQNNDAAYKLHSKGSHEVWAKVFLYFHVSQGHSVTWNKLKAHYFIYICLM